MGSNGLRLMATAKRAINVYVPKDLEQYLTEYCAEYGITRKDKAGNLCPALGTGVLEILKHFFNGDAPSNAPSHAPSNVSNEQIQAIQAEVRFSLMPEFAALLEGSKLLKTEVAQLQDRVEALERLAIAPKLEEVEAATVNEKIPSAPLEPVADKIDAIATPINTSSDDESVETDAGELLTATQMAKLFPGIGSKVNPSQRFRDWARRGNGKAELSGLGYQAIAQLDGKGKTNYFFQAIVIE